MNYISPLIIGLLLLTACSQTPLESQEQLQGQVHVIPAKAHDYRCELTPQQGPCKAAFPRYFFHERSQSCKEFTWGGCQGVVPFETLEECKNACEPSPCTLLPDAGPCKASIEKYYFDSSTNTCKEFSWGGCKGNVPFDTLNDCQSQCEP